MNPRKQRSPFVISFTIFAAAAAASALVAYAVAGPPGLQGAAIGVAIAALMCGVSFGLLARARRGQGQAIVMAVMGGALASLFILSGSMLVIGMVAKDKLAAASLSALAVYLAYRLTEAVAVRRPVERSSACQGGSAP